MKIMSQFFIFIMLIVNVASASSSFLIRDRLENYKDNPEYNVLACTSDRWLNDYTFVIAKKRNDFGGPVGLFYSYEGLKAYNLFLDTSGLPSPYNHDWKSFRSHTISPENGFHNARYWFVVKWSNDSGSELLPDFEIRVFMQRQIPYLYPQNDYLDSVLRCKLKN